MLIKAQAYGTFIQTMPPAMALRITRISNDPEAEGAIIENSPIYKAFLSNINKSAQNEQTENLIV